ncbi:MAG: GntR family transcriptional regulator [Beijerinckiaceae bacterium]|nr:GntR family transcriptional regulator [Beijerinckiaceae bacterium]
MSDLQTTSLLIDPLADVAAAIRHHPRFDAATLHYSQGVLAFREGPRLLNKISSSHARSQIAGYLIYLYFEADPDDPDDGPTYQKLLELTQARRDCGPRVLKTILAILRLARFVSLSEGRRDRRLKIYRPTEKMIAFTRDWYASAFGSFDVLDPTGGYAGRVRDEANFLRHVVLSIARPYIGENIQLAAFYPTMFKIYMTDSGTQVAATLVSAHLNGGTIPAPQAIADRFGSSASQVRNVLRKLADWSLIEMTGGGRIQSITPLLDLYQNYVARELALYAKYAVTLPFIASSAPQASLSAADTPVHSPMVPPFEQGAAGSPHQSG